MKYHLINAIRALGLLKIADTVKFWLNRVAVYATNKKFQQENPGFSVPPYELAFDAYNHINWYTYRDGGKKHAEVFAKIVSENIPSGPLSIFEWGCGPGRLIRHWSELMKAREVQIYGSDYNPQTIKWCKENFPQLNFSDNKLMPPLEYPDSSFDVVYNFSVLTHLSEEAQIAWVNELHRVLKTGGLLICTTHGENYRYLLTKKSEKTAYENGLLIEQGGYKEGKKWFFAIHPPTYVRGTLFKNFEGVELHSVEQEAGLLQDVWVAHKCEMIEAASKC